MTKQRLTFQKHMKPTTIMVTITKIRNNLEDTMKVALVCLIISLALGSVLLAQDRGTVTYTSSNNTQVSIPDYANGNLGYRNSAITINNSTIGSATITNVAVSFTVNHTYHADLVVELSTNANSHGNYNMFNRSPNGSGNLSRTFSTVSSFNGEPVNQTYFLNVWDCAAGHIGTINQFSVTVSFYNASPSFVTTPSFNTYAINTGGSATITVDAQDPADNISLYLVRELSNGTQNSTSQIPWAYFVSGNTHRYIGTFSFNTAGTWNWRVYAQDSFNQRTYYPSSTTWSSNPVVVTTPNSPPNAFSKLSPANTANLTSTSVRLQWNPTTDPNGDPITYYVVLHDQNDNEVSSWNGLTTSQTPYFTILPNMNYYWQVWAFDNHGSSTEANSSAWWNFTYSDQSPAEFSKTQPANNANITSSSVLLRWNSSTDPEGSAVSYTVILHDESENEIGNWPNLTATQIPNPVTIQPNVRYYWQVWALDNHGNSTAADGSAWWNFIWANQAPAAFGKISPNNGVSITGPSVSLQWQQATDPDGDPVVYDVELNTDDSQNIRSWSGLTAISVTYDNLASNTNYYWYVKARDSHDNQTEADNGTWWYFNTNTVNHAPEASISSVVARMTTRNPVQSGNINLGTYLSGNPSFKIHKNTLLTFTASATDVDAGQSFTYEWRSNGSLISTAQSFSTSSLLPGSQNVTLRVYDSFDPPAYDDATFPAFEIVDIPTLRFPFNGTMYSAGPNGGLFYGEGTTHLNSDLYAIDWNAGAGNSDRGKVIRAAASGKVKSVAYSSGGYGFHVIVSKTIGNKEYQNHYAHLTAISVKQQDEVLTGDEIGLMGNTGNADGAHLHWANYVIEGGNLSPFVPEPIIATNDYMSIIQSGTPNTYPLTTITSQNVSNNPRRVTKDSANNGLDSGYWQPINTYTNTSEPVGYDGSYQYYINQSSGTGASWSFPVSAYEPTICVPEVFIPAISTNGCPTVKYTVTVNGQNPTETIISHAFENISGCPYTGKWIQLSPVLISSNATVTIRVSNYSNGYQNKKIIVDAARIISFSSIEIVGGGAGYEYTTDGDALNFGSCMVNEYQTDDLLLANTGTVPLKIIGTSSDNPCFYANIDSALSTMAEGDSLYIPIVFSPDTSGILEGNVTIFINDTELVIHCSGVGVAGTGFLQSSVAFSSILGLSYNQEVTLHNSQAIQMVVEEFSFNDQYLDASGISVNDVIQPVSSLTITIKYNPLAVCDAYDTLTVITNLGGYSLPIHLQANAADESTSTLDKIRLSANYIISCQYDAAEDPGTPDWPADGCINDIYPAANASGIQNYDWVVPRENAMAILGLQLAYEKTSDTRYYHAAGKAVQYLVNIQDTSDGAWYNQYNKCTPYSDLGKSPTQTAEVMIALFKYGYRPDLYESMQKGADYLISCTDIANKTGNDDGLLCGGKNSSGTFYTDRWASDNSYAYQALRAAEEWALQLSDFSRAKMLNQIASRIIQGIENSMLDPVNYIWYKKISASGSPDMGSSEWINYAPAMLDLPLAKVSNAYVGEWIHTKLQGSDGAVRWNNTADYDKRSPGYSFQANLVWNDHNQLDYVASATDWAYSSGLWRTYPDANNAVGGWIDWKTSTAQANWWERFIDTEFYWMTTLTDGYDFSTNSIKQIRNNAPVNLGSFVSGSNNEIGFQLQNYTTETVTCSLQSISTWLQITSGTTFDIGAGGQSLVLCEVSSDVIGNQTGIIRVLCAADTTYMYFDGSFVARDNPRKPENLTLSVQNSSLRLQWSPVIETICDNLCAITRYKVYGSTDPMAEFPTNWAYLGETVNAWFDIAGMGSNGFFKVIAEGDLVIAPPDFVYLPGGVFTMGRTKSGGDADELPTHSVDLSPYYISMYEVTQEQWTDVMDNNPSYFSGNLSKPVEEVSWYHALVFCNKKSISEGLTPVYTILGSTDPDTWGAVPTTGNVNWNSAQCNWEASGYRLPTEAEWEYAARGATNDPDYIYSGSDDWILVSWYITNSGNETHPVGQKPPNDLGIYDMSGNCWEWCWDWYAGDYYSASPSNDPRGPLNGTYKALRGGSWGNTNNDCRLASRYGSYYPQSTNPSFGLRLVRSVPQ